MSRNTMLRDPLSTFCIYAWYSMMTVSHDRTVTFLTDFTKTEIALSCWDRTSIRSRYGPSQPKEDKVPMFHCISIIEHLIFPLLFRHSVDNPNGLHKDRNSFIVLGSYIHQESVWAILPERRYDSNVSLYLYYCAFDFPTTFQSFRR